jgi:predicted acylesterase/phospholipase RssA
VRIAVALPVRVEAVRVESELYVDGSAVDAVPVRPLISEGGFDRIFDLNLMPHHPDARRSRRRLGESLTLIEPIPDDELHRFAFYDLFLDRRRWPDLMRRGYSAAVEALAPFRRSGRGRRSA